MNNISGQYLTLLLYMAILLGITLQGKAQSKDCQGGLWVPQWQKKEVDASGAYELRSDKKGNIYTIGQDNEEDTGSFLLIKYDREGQLIWKRSFAAPNNSQHIAVAMDLDPKGDIVMTGNSTLSSGMQVNTVKWDQNGKLLWAHEHRRPGFPQTYATDICTDRDGNSFVTGRTNSGNASHDNDIFVLKLDSKGQLAWERTFSGIHKNDDQPEVVRADRKGNVLIGGYTKTSGLEKNFLIVKYNKRGDLLWSGTYKKGSQVKSMELDKQDNIYVSGAAIPHKAILKFAPDGSLLWEAMLPDAAAGGHPLALDRRNNVLVTGNSIRDNSLITAKFSKKGKLIWTQVWDESPGFVYDITTDKLQNVYLLNGLKDHHSSQASILVYSKNGHKIFEDIYAFQHEEILLRDLEISPSGDIHFSAWEDYGVEDNLTVKYQTCKFNKYTRKLKSANKLAVREPEPLNKDVSLSVFPNPAHGLITIEFSLTLDIAVDVELHNLFGEKLQTIHSGKAEKGTLVQTQFNCAELPAGPYVIWLNTKAGKSYPQMLMVVEL